MSVVLVTGSSGLIGSQAVEFFAGKGHTVVGVDNNLRQYFFGDNASTEWNRQRLQEKLPAFIHREADIRDCAALEEIYQEYNEDIALIIHTAAQPSHDWAAREPLTDFSVNATGTINLLELARQHCPQAVFIFCSTNKVYGDRPNTLPLIEQQTRFELPEDHPYYQGIDEEMSIDQCKHSLFGASKVAADVVVQEYGRYFGMKTGVFRGGCLTGPAHSGTELHGFLSYIVRCAITGQTYRVFGYKGKQVRDNIHSYDLVNAFDHFYQRPSPGAVYNIGGSRFSNVSLQEAVAMTEEIVGKKMTTQYEEANRIGDHIWWISDVNRFQKDYPGWSLTYNCRDIIEQIFALQKDVKGGKGV